MQQTCNPFSAVLFFLFLFGTTFAFAQKPQDDVLYVKNGWILRGKLLSQPADSLVKIQTYDQNTFVFQRNEISDIRREPTLRNINIRYRKKGFAHYTELGALASRNTTSNQTTTSAFTFHTVNGYKFNPYLFTGLGAGVDLYATQTFMPVFASIRGDLYHKTNLVPYYYVDGGYGFNATANTDETIRFLGGLHFATGLGLKILFNNNTAFLLSAGYYLQETATERKQGGEGRNKQNYERVAIRAGFSF
jgi:hypothetical protein